MRTFVSLPAGFTATPVAPFPIYAALGTMIWAAALACVGVILRANFAIVGDYIDTAAIVLLGVLAVVLVRRYVRCWKQSRSG